MYSSSKPKYIKPNNFIQMLQKASGTFRLQLQKSNGILDSTNHLVALKATSGVGRVKRSPIKSAWTFLLRVITKKTEIIVDSTSLDYLTETDTTISFLVHPPINPNLQLSNLGARAQEAADGGGFIMCPSVPLEADEIDFLSTDEEVVISLEGLLRGDPLPVNVITGVNPCSVPPWDLPEGIWFFSSVDRKAAISGYWQVTAENNTVFTNSFTIGSRATLEYFAGQAPDGTKTNWVMHEFTIDQKGSFQIDKAQSSRSLSRIFLSYDQITNNEERTSAHPPDVNGNSFPSDPEAKEENSEDSTSRCQGIKRDEKHGRANANLDLHEIYNFSSGDFLELADLDIQESLSSSSANSSFRFPDEYFNAAALLRELEPAEDEDTQQKHADTKFSVSAPVRPNKVVMRPESLGSPPGNNLWPSDGGENVILDSTLPNLPLKQNGEASDNVGDLNENPSTVPEEDLASSSNGIRAAAVESKPVGRMAKLKKKYWCFMPF